MKQLDNTKLLKKALPMYLNHGLKFMRTKDDNLRGSILIMDGLYPTGIDHQGVGYSPQTFHTQFLDCKPILRPLSDLTKEITNSLNQTFVFTETLEIGDDDNGTEYDYGNIKTIKSLEFISENNNFHDVHYLPYLLVQDLIKNHFDVFGIIEKGLAIDINTLEI